MPTFTLTGDLDPFLHVSLEAGESISCESGAMVMMEANLDLTGQMQGGFLSALTRRLVNGESFSSSTSKPRAAKAIACSRQPCPAACTSLMSAKRNTTFQTAPISPPPAA